MNQNSPCQVIPMMLVFIDLVLDGSCQVILMILVSIDLVQITVNDVTHFRKDGE